MKEKIEQFSETMHDENQYGHLWAELFISVIIARCLTLFDTLSDVNLVILIPVTLVIIHLVFGKLIKKYSYKKHG